jgi:hypothetical protein
MFKTTISNSTYLKNKTDLNQIMQKNEKNFHIKTAQDSYN